MDQTRYTLLGLIITIALAVMSGLGAQWYQAGARPDGSQVTLLRNNLEETRVAVTQTAIFLPTPVGQISAEPTPQPTPTYYGSLYNRARNWQLITYDAFDNNNRGWGSGEASNRVSGRRGIDDGFYFWDLEAVDDFTWSTAPISAPFDEYLVSVEVAKNSAEIASSGLVFHFIDFDNYYQFSLCSDDASFELWRKLEENWTNLIPCQKNGVISAEGSNRLAIVVQNGSFFLYINDTYVDSIDDNSLTGGSVGVSVDMDLGQRNFITFDNFILRSPLDE